MSQDERQADARHCPRCGALGILPLGQRRQSDGSIVDPVMLCPMCEVEFPATGMRYRTFVAPKGESTDQDRQDFANEVLTWLRSQAD